MASEDKTAAAILAAEASRQKLEVIPEKLRVGHDISGQLLTYYRHFLKELEKPENQPVG